jgi:hypothetical protein
MKFQPICSSEYPLPTFKRSIGGNGQVGGEYLPTDGYVIAPGADPAHAYNQIRRDLPDPAALAAFSLLTDAIANSTKRLLFLQGAAGCGKTTLIETAIEISGLKHEDQRIGTVDCAGLTGRELIWEIKFSNDTETRLSKIENAAFEKTEDKTKVLLFQHFLQELETLIPGAVNEDKQKIHWGKIFSSSEENPELKDSIKTLIDDLSDNANFEKTGGLGYEEVPGPIPRAYDAGVPLLADEFNTITDTAYLHRIIQAFNGENKAPVTVVSLNGQQKTFSKPDRENGNFFMILATGNKGIESDEVNNLSTPLKSRSLTIQIDSESTDILQQSFEQRGAQLLTKIPINAHLAIQGKNFKNLTQEDEASEVFIDMYIAGSTDEEQEHRETQLATHPYHMEFIRRPLELAEGLKRYAQLMLKIREKVLEEDIEGVIDVRYTNGLLQRAIELNPATAIDKKIKIPQLGDKKFNRSNFLKSLGGVKETSISIANFGERLAVEIDRSILDLGLSNEAISEINEEARKLRIYEDESTIDVDSEYPKFMQFTEQKIEITKELKDTTKKLEAYIREHFRDDIIKSLKGDLNRKPTAEEITEAVESIKINPYEVKKQLDLVEKTLEKETGKKQIVIPIANTDSFDPNKAGSKYILPAVVHASGIPKKEELPSFENLKFQLTDNYLLKQLFENASMHPFKHFEPIKEVCDTTMKEKGVDFAVMHYRNSKDEIESGFLIRKDNKVAAICLPEVESLGIPNIQYGDEDTLLIDEQETAVTNALEMDPEDSLYVLMTIKQIAFNILDDSERCFVTPHLKVIKDKIADNIKNLDNSKTQPEV